MAKTALVTGASGFLGRQVMQAFQSAGWNTVGTAFTRANRPSILKVDLTEAAEVASLLQEVRPAVVVHCAANRFPDKCDADPDSARSINVEASKHLVKATSTQDILLIYISTDYVFPGTPGDAPYEADAVPAPTNWYGQTKLDGEKAILEETSQSHLGVVLRVPVLYGRAETPKESAVNVLMDALWKSQGDNVQVEMDAWAQRYPTNIEDVARVCVDVSVKYLDRFETRRRLPKVLQFTSEEKMTKYEICQVFADIMGLPMKGIVAEKQGGNHKASVQRPYDTHLSTKELKGIEIDVGTQDFKAWWRREVKAFKK